MDSAGDAAPDRGGIAECDRAAEGLTIGGRILCFLEGAVAGRGSPAMRLFSQQKELVSVYRGADLTRMYFTCRWGIVSFKKDVKSNRCFRVTKHSQSFRA
jgi:hypothetical protein